MKTIRIFISSPSDVAQERERASQVIQSLQRRYSRKFHLAPVFWENLPLEPDMSFQQGIDLFLKNPGVDVAIFILWSRLGSPLGTSFRKADGSTYRSGTEREYDLMIQARAQSRAAEGDPRPRMVFYTRRDDNSFDARLRGKSTAEKKEMLSQKELVESFMKETFKDAESGENIGAYHPFDRPVNFSQRLRVHLQTILDEFAGDMDDVIWDVSKQGPPFLGLDAFQPEHADIFFGREEEVLEARNALREKAVNGCAFLLLSGASGSGKSSLARAGILPEILTHESDENAEVWKSLILTPAELGSDPVLGLLKSLADSTLLPELLDQVPSLEKLSHDLSKNAANFFDYAFPKAFEAAKERLGGTARFLLVIDQLEELFTKEALTHESRAAFLSLLETFARSGRFWIIATARSDFYQQIQSEPALLRMKEGHGLLDVLPPQPDAIARLIEEPARLAGISFEEKEGQLLSHRILRDAAQHAELLPLLEFVLLELFNRVNSKRQLTHAAYEQLGGVTGALRGKADATFANLSTDAQQSLGVVLQTLVTLGEEGERGESEKAVRQSAALSLFQECKPSRELVDAFIAARLFTTGKTIETGEATVTLAHESLLRVWPRAADWVDCNRSNLRRRDRIRQAMRRWDAEMRPSSLLLTSGKPLEDGRYLLRSHGDVQIDDIRFFLEASIRRQRVLRNSFLLSAAAVVLAMVFLTLYAFSQSERAREGLRSQLSGLSQSSRVLRNTGQPFEAMLSAYRAGGTVLEGRIGLSPSSDTWKEVHEALQWSLFQVNERNRLEGHTDEVWSISFSPDGRLIATAGSDKTVKIWDQSGTERVTLTGHAGPVVCVCFSPDGKTIATASYDKIVKIWNCDGQCLDTFPRGNASGHKDRVYWVAFSPDGKMVASASKDGTVRLWSIDGTIPDVVLRCSGIADKSDGGFNTVAFRALLRIIFQDGRQSHRV